MIEVDPNGTTLQKEHRQRSAEYPDLVHARPPTNTSLQYATDG